MSIKMRQLIIARKDLQMSSGKLSVQCCHASLAFITSPMRDLSFCTLSRGELKIPVSIDKDTYENWICGIFANTICEAKSRNQLLKAKRMAEELGLAEGKDFFLIKDRCLTELEPEEIYEDGTGGVLTCIGFRPLPDEIVQQISKKFQLYK